MNSSLLRRFSLLLLLLVIVEGCKKDDNPTESTDNPGSFVGTWKLTKVSVNMNGATVDLTPEQADTQVTIVAGSDGSYKGTTTTVSTGVVTTVTGTWKVNGTKLDIKFSDGTSETIELTVTGNKCTIKRTVPFMGALYPATLEFTKQ